MRALLLITGLAGLALLTACAPSSDDVANRQAVQHTSDQQTCSGYGFTPGTDAFANCMMSTSQNRTAQEQIQRQQNTTIDANQHLLSASRNGNTQYPVCTAGSLRSRWDAANMAWSGQNCREK